MEFCPEALSPLIPVPVDSRGFQWLLAVAQARLPCPWGTPPSLLSDITRGPGFTSCPCLSPRSSHVFREPGPFCRRAVLRAPAQPSEGAAGRRCLWGHVCVLVCEHCRVHACVCVHVCPSQCTHICPHLAQAPHPNLSAGTHRSPTCLVCGPGGRSCCPAARQGEAAPRGPDFWAAQSCRAESADAACLVSGRRGAVSRLLGPGQPVPCPPAPRPGLV